LFLGKSKAEKTGVVMSINMPYVKLLLGLRVAQEREGYQVSRGAGVFSHFGYNFGRVGSCPVVTIRKTAWKTALKELEWFMSGDDACPEGVLRDVWWKGQLNPNDELMHSYPAQLRCSPTYDGHFDQIAWLREELKTNPSSRRLCLTAWNPGSMATMVEDNQNDMTPTVCHTVWNQFSVRNGQLHMNAVFRSTDVVLGLPHNLVQHRALQLYFAYHARVPAAPFYTLFCNDVHYYDHPDHHDFVNYLGENTYACLGHGWTSENELLYTPTSNEFRAKDFSIRDELPEPLYTRKIARTL